VRLRVFGLINISDIENSPQIKYAPIRNSLFHFRGGFNAFMAEKIRKAVFPAAGLGTRFLPATKASPKEMLPLVDKPLIQYVVEEAVASGIESVVIVTGRGKTAIEDHFDISFELEHLLSERGKEDMLAQVRAISEMARFSYVRQKEALGLGHAVLQAKDIVGSEPFAVMLSDDIVDAEVPALRQMLEVYEKYDAPVIGTMQVEGEAISRFGVIDAEEVSDGVYKINGMVEKPPFNEAPSDLAIIGRYILTPDIFEEIENTTPGAGGEIQLTDAMRSLLKKRPFYAVRFEGTRHDAGDKLGFLIATVEFALKRSDLSPEFRDYLRTLKL
jgi:UTP--glucose-1-phosphate uridylyltransferase